MAAVRRKQAHRQPAPPDMRTLIHEAAINGASRMEISTPTLDALASAWPQALRVGWSCFAWVGGAVGAGSYLLDHNPLMAAANLFVTGGPAAFLVTIVWSVTQRSENVTTQYIEFDTSNGNGHVPAGEPVRDARFVKPDATRPGHVVELPGDWTAERLQTFARRLAQVDYDVTVRSWVPQFCSYEQLKALLDWLEQHELVQVTDGRGTKAVRARAKRIMQQWADGHIDAL